MKKMKILKMSRRIIDKSIKNEFNMFSIIGKSGNRIEFSEFKNGKVLYDGYWVSRSSNIPNKMSSFEDNTLIRLKTHCYSIDKSNSSNTGVIGSENHFPQLISSLSHKRDYNRRNIYIKNESINNKPILYINACNGYRILDFCDIDVKVYQLSPMDLKNKYTKVDYVEFLIKSNYIVKTKVKLLK